MLLLTAIRYRLEYAAVRALMAVADRIPLRWCPGLAAVIGDAGYLFAARRRSIATENILRSSLAPNPASARRMTRRSFRHFALVLLETLKAQRLITPATLAEHVAFEVPPETGALLDDPRRGFLVACGHFGNWEVMGPIVGFRKDSAAIAQPMKNPLVENLVKRRTPGSHFRTIPKEIGNMMGLVRTLRQGCALGVMIDQYALKKPILVDFLGRPACSHRGIALLHLLTRSPIVYASCRRTGPLRFAIRLSEPLMFESAGDREKDTFTIVKALNERLEADIRSAPEQYLWSHRRWRPPKPWALAARSSG